MKLFDIYKMNVWKGLFGKDGVFTSTLDSSRIEYHGKPGTLCLHQGNVWGGYCNIVFHPDESPIDNAERLFGGLIVCTIKYKNTQKNKNKKQKHKGSMFNAMEKECRQKFKEFVALYGKEGDLTNPHEKEGFEDGKEGMEGQKSTGDN